MRSSSLRLAVLGLFLGSASAFAQSPADTVVRPLLLNVTRVESWSFFEPPNGGGDPDYTLVSNRARLAVRVDARRVSFEGAFQYSQLLGLPRHAVGPGPLGPGALYFASAGTPEAYQLFFKSMSLRVKDVLPQMSVQAGRMSYESGEGTPFAGRLIGNTEWTPFERSFDGVRVDYERTSWRGHFSFLMPTQGVFEESASPTIGKVQLTSASWTGAAVALFVHNYRDLRAVQARPDNTGIPADRVDINMQTMGASAQIRGAHLWGAVQRGSWFDQPHRAFSASADYGHRWDSRWRPDVRAGLMYASGDGDPNDARHGTFFPMVPTTRPDLLRGTIAMMNLRDLYGHVVLRPRARLSVEAEVHQLSLARRLDGWYSGTGATAFDGEYFGFSSRRSTLRTGLGTFLQLSATATMNQYWTVSASAGVMRGGDVVRRQFAGGKLFVMALESTVALR